MLIVLLLDDESDFMDHESNSAFASTVAPASIVTSLLAMFALFSRAGLKFDHEEAHSARYDADVTAQLFCEIVNRWRDLCGWNPHQDSAAP